LKLKKRRILKVKVDKKLLSSALAVANEIISKATIMPILGYCMINITKNNIEVLSTNLDVFISKNIICESIEEGGALFPAKIIWDIVKGLPDGEIEISSTSDNNSWVIIKSGKIKFKIACLSTSEFPQKPDIKVGKSLLLKTETLTKLIYQLSPTVSTDSNRIALGGILFEVQNKTLTVVSTDGHRLTLNKVNIEDDITARVIVPSVSLKSLSSLSAEEPDVRIYLTNGSYLLFQSGNSKIAVRLLSGEFPEYNRIIQTTSPKNIEVNKQLLLDGVKRIKIMRDEITKHLKLSISNNTIILSSINPEAGEAKETIEANYTGENCTVGFNSEYLEKMLMRFDGEIVNISLSDEFSPCFFRDKENLGYLGIISPMKA